MTNRESNKEAALRWIDDFLDELKKTPHRYADDIDGLDRVRAALTSPQQETEGREITDDMVERATLAAERVMPSVFRGEVGVGEFDKMIRATLTAALRAERPHPAVGG